MVRIQWVVDGRKKDLPVENIDELVTSNSRSRRKRCKTQFLQQTSSPESKGQSNSKSRKKARTSSNVTEKNKARKARKSPSKNASNPSTAKSSAVSKPPLLSSISSPKLKQRFEEVEELSKESAKQQYYLKYLYGGNKLKKIETTLDKDKSEVLLDKSIVIDGTTYHLFTSKLKEVSQKPSIYEKMTNKRCVAYYVQDTPDNIKKLLDKIAGFSSLALEPGKLCSRLELMVSPACSLCNGIFEMKSDDFELIAENGHIGEFNTCVIYCWLLSLSKYFIINHGCLSFIEQDVVLHHLSSSCPISRRVCWQFKFGSLLLH